MGLALDWIPVGIGFTVGVVIALTLMAGIALVLGWLVGKLD